MAALADGADAKQPVHGFFHARVWRPLAEAVGEAYRKQYYPLGYIPALDGLRGLMTVGVMVAHVYWIIGPFAVLFLDFFFLMSGYYITSLLLRDIQRHDGIRYREFYRRRFARILPAFLLMVLGYLLFCSIFVPTFRDALFASLIALSYISNWWQAFQIPGIGNMGHTWTLAVEEQFYLLWPISLALLVRICGVRWRLVCAIGGIAFAFWGWRIWLTMTDAPWPRLYYGLDTRADALMVGCALSVGLTLLPAGAYPKIERFLPKLGWPLLTLPFIIGALFTTFPTPSYFYAGIMLCGALPGAVLVTVLVRTSDTSLHRFLERPKFVFLGRIFYGMYLWHYPILFAMRDLTGASSLVLAAVGLPLTVLMSTLSYAYIERHFMRVRNAPAQPAATVPVYVPTAS